MNLLLFPAKRILSASQPPLWILLLHILLSFGVSARSLSCGVGAGVLPHSSSGSSLYRMPSNVWFPARRERFHPSGSRSRNTCASDRRKTSLVPSSSSHHCALLASATTTPNQPDNKPMSYQDLTFMGRVVAGSVEVGTFFERSLFWNSFLSCCTAKGGQAVSQATTTTIDRMTRMIPQSSHHRCRPGFLRRLL